MLDNVNLTLLAGGFYRCTSRWTKNATGIDRCYKCYVPVEGEARLEMDDGAVDITPGHIYLLSGFHLRKQVCTGDCWMYWIHFAPESLFLRYLMDQSGPVQSWSTDTVDLPDKALRDLPGLFEEPFTEESHVSPDSSPSLTCWLQAFLLTLVAKQLSALEEKAVQSFQPLYYRLKPAIDFMDERFTANPSLADVAARVHLAPTYFHRQFQSLFGVSPFSYMLHRRMNLARHLLTGTTLSIKEVAEQTGYDNPLYFSRVFRQQMQESPSEYRAREVGG